MKELHLYSKKTAEHTTHESITKFQKQTFTEKLYGMKSFTTNYECNIEMQISV